ncbi:MAG: hypothetical protein AAF184_10520 [Pseudomonadota bacterium]
MMDDLASPLEHALIVYNRIERALLRAPMRQIAPVLGVALLAAAGWLTTVSLGDQANAWLTGAGKGLHLCLALIAFGVGAGMVLRQAWAIVVGVVVVGLLQVLPYALVGGAVFVTGEALRIGLTAVGAELFAMVAVAMVIAGDDG